MNETVPRCETTHCGCDRSRVTDAVAVMHGHSHGTWRVFDLLIEALAGDLIAAGFEVHYQPIVRLDSEVPVALEALARWRHPAVGEVEPARFVALAESAGLMGVLDDFVLERACADLDALSRAHGCEIALHVNVSASRLGRRDLETAVGWALQRHRVRPDRLVLEITETSRIVDLEAAGAAVQRIRERDVRVALDDFGAGFNALAQLHALPVDTIKLDAALSSNVGEPWRHEALCRSILTICRDLGLTVVAEGLETPAQVLTLMQLGCRLGQGHLFGPALRLEQLLPGIPERGRIVHED